MTPLTPASRLPGFSGSMFAQMARVATQFSALNLAQGYPDFSPSNALLEALAMVSKGNHHQYSLSEGVVALREAIAQMYQTLYALSFHTDSEITITGGATQAIFTTINGLLHAGDEVVYLTPAFECYAPAITWSSTSCATSNTKAQGELTKVPPP